MTIEINGFGMKQTTEFVNPAGKMTHGRDFHEQVDRRISLSTGIV